MLRFARQLSSIASQMTGMHMAAFYPCANWSGRNIVEGTDTPKMGLDRDKIRRFHYGGIL